MIAAPAGGGMWSRPRNRSAGLSRKVSSTANTIGRRKRAREVHRVERREHGNDREADRRGRGAGDRRVRCARGRVRARRRVLGVRRRSDRGAARARSAETSCFSRRDRPTIPSSSVIQIIWLILCKANDIPRAAMPEILRFAQDDRV